MRTHPPAPLPFSPAGEKGRGLEYKNKANLFGKRKIAGDDLMLAYRPPSFCAKRKGRGPGGGSSFPRCLFPPVLQAQSIILSA